jgi:hypothetical protein
MAKQTPAQKRTTERVMHEFKHGELETGGGRKVKSRRQAVAIALSEAGASKFESSAENERDLRRSKRNGTVKPARSTLKRAARSAVKRPARTSSATKRSATSKTRGTSGRPSARRPSTRKRRSA